MPAYHGHLCSLHVADAVSHSPLPECALAPSAEPEQQED